MVFYFVCVAKDCVGPLWAFIRNEQPQTKMPIMHFFPGFCCAWREERLCTFMPNLTRDTTMSWIGSSSIEFGVNVDHVKRSATIQKCTHTHSHTYGSNAHRWHDGCHIGNDGTEFRAHGTRSCCGIRWMRIIFINDCNIRRCSSYEPWATCISLAWHSSSMWWCCCNFLCVYLSMCAIACHM